MFMTAEVLGKFFLLQKDTRCSFPMAAAATTNSLLFVRPRPMFANNIKRSQMMMACCCSVGEQVFSVTPSNNYEVDYLGQSTKGDLNLNLDHLDAVGIDGPATFQGPIEEVARKNAEEAENLLNDLGISVSLLSLSPGKDGLMIIAWEIYKAWVSQLMGLAFDPDLVIRGLVIDKEKGNLVKADRFGYVKRAMHGTRMLSTQDVR
ncbi:hypothetical protein NC653_022005 [Populus alba x Populus x berolinensis]|uniref:Uncharacterized protein n=1 Tax=Populus alba x Populus x berolinensis TaxID=444605 RepID=A0AAD6QF94_9ROSI|nr:hypothetical protein NC653_022005 [Populus alba x Populus x berolinensis]